MLTTIEKLLFLVVVAVALYYTWRNFRTVYLVIRRGQGDFPSREQVVGWLPIHVIQGLELPYWLGTWFGVYSTWESLGLQVAAAIFVIGSYYLAEGMRMHRLFALKQPKVKSTVES